MLEIPPPTSSRNVQAPVGVEPIDMSISSDDEGSWQLIRSGSGKITRRRTTSERPNGEFIR